MAAPFPLPAAEPSPSAFPNPASGSRSPRLPEEIARAVPAAERLKRAGNPGPRAEVVTHVPVEVTRAQIVGVTITGSWKVRRLSGLLPPGVTKQIDGDRGRTLLFGRHFGSFRVDGDRLVYTFWPIVDELEAHGDAIDGRGTVCGLTFCRFRLERR